MKKTLLVLSAAMCLLITTATAQNYKPFKLGLGLGYVVPSDGGGGVLIDLEPAYRLNDQIAIGLRLESAAMARAIGDTEADVSANGSYSLNGIYYLSDAKFRPYVGLGVGLFTIASASASVTVGGSTVTAAAADENKFGFYPRIGFDLGHFNINIDYNIIGASDGITIAGTSFATEDIKNSYIGIRIGGFFFGGEN